MPTYDYECLNCGESFEIFQKMNDSHLKECPKCKGKIKRLIGSGSGLIFKGSGFYVTDYKKKNAADSGNKQTDKQTSEPAQAASSSSPAEIKKKNDG